MKKVLALGYLPKWRGGRQTTGLATGLFDLHDAVNETSSDYEVTIAATDVFKKHFKSAHTPILGWTKGILLMHMIKRFYRIPFFLSKSYSFSRSYPNIISFLDTFAKLVFLDYAIEMNNPDIIHLHGAIGALYFEALWRNERPVILRLHGINGFDSTIPGYLNYRKLEKDILKNRYSTVTFVTTNVCEDWKSKYGSFNCLMIPIVNGFNANVFFTPDEKIEKKYDLITISGIQNRKGQGRVIEAMKMLKDEGINLSYLIVGSGCKEYVERIKQDAKNNELNVEFVEYCAQDKLNNLLWASKWFIQPSVSEGFGKTYIESAAAGIPFILPEHLPIVKERGIVSDKNALLTKDESSLEIYNTLRKMDFTQCYNDKIVAESVAHLAWQAIAVEYSKIYQLS